MEHRLTTQLEKIAEQWTGLGPGELESLQDKLRNTGMRDLFERALNDDVPLSKEEVLFQIEETLRVAPDSLSPSEREEAELMLKILGDGSHRVKTAGTVESLQDFDFRGYDMAYAVITDHSMYGWPSLGILSEFEGLIKVCLAEGWANPYAGDERIQRLLEADPNDPDIEDELEDLAYEGIEALQEIIISNAIYGFYHEMYGYPVIDFYGVSTVDEGTKENIKTLLGNLEQANSNNLEGNLSVTGLESLSDAVAEAYELGEELESGANGVSVTDILYALQSESVDIGDVVLNEPPDPSTVPYECKWLFDSSTGTLYVWSVRDLYGIRGWPHHSHVADWLFDQDIEPDGMGHAQPNGLVDIIEPDTFAEAREIASRFVGFGNTVEFLGDTYPLEEFINPDITPTKILSELKQSIQMRILREVKVQEGIDLNGLLQMSDRPLPGGNKFLGDRNVQVFWIPIEEDGTYHPDGLPFHSHVTSALQHILDEFDYFSGYFANANESMMGYPPHGAKVFTDMAELTEEDLSFFRDLFQEAEVCWIDDELIWDNRLDHRALNEETYEFRPDDEVIMIYEGESNGFSWEVGDTATFMQYRPYPNRAWVDLHNAQAPVDVSVNMFKKASLSDSKALQSSGGIYPLGDPSEALSEALSGLREQAEKYPIAGGEVDGLIVRDEIPNLSSVDSSLLDYEVLPGIREIPTEEFTYNEYVTANDLQRVRNLAEGINESGEINPLIVVVDGHPAGPYILEGGHRSEALHLLGKRSLPALVVLDLESQTKQANELDFRMSPDEFDYYNHHEVPFYDSVEDPNQFYKFITIGGQHYFWPAENVPNPSAPHHGYVARALGAENKYAAELAGYYIPAGHKDARGWIGEEGWVIPDAPMIDVIADDEPSDEVINDLLARSGATYITWNRENVTPQLKQAAFRNDIFVIAPDGYIEKGAGDEWHDNLATNMFDKGYKMYTLVRGLIDNDGELVITPFGIAKVTAPSDEQWEVISEIAKSPDVVSVDMEYPRFRFEGSKEDFLNWMPVKVAATDLSRMGVHSTPVKGFNRFLLYNNQPYFWAAFADTSRGSMTHNTILQELTDEPEDEEMVWGYYDPTGVYTDKNFYALYYGEDSIPPDKLEMIKSIVPESIGYSLNGGDMIEWNSKIGGLSFDGQPEWRGNDSWSSGYNKFVIEPHGTIYHWTTEEFDRPHHGQVMMGITKDWIWDDEYWEETWYPEDYESGGTEFRDQKMQDGWIIGDLYDNYSALVILGLNMSEPQQKSIAELVQPLGNHLTDVTVDIAGINTNSLEEFMEFLGINPTLEANYVEDAMEEGEELSDDQLRAIFPNAIDFKDFENNNLWGMNKDSMASQTGDPDFDVLLNEFKNEGVFLDIYNPETEEVEGKFIEVWELEDANLSTSQCGRISNEFEQFLSERGIKHVEHGNTETEGPKALNYTDWSNRWDYTDNSHGWTEVYLNGHIYAVDWTASQYGNYDFPMVQRMDQPMPDKYDLENWNISPEEYQEFIDEYGEDPEEFEYYFGYEPAKIWNPNWDKEANYVEDAREVIEEKIEEFADESPEDWGEDHDELLDFYTLLYLTKGEDVTTEDIHDAWSLWQADLDSEHESLVPFDELDEEIQDYDEPYADAVKNAILTPEKKRKIRRKVRKKRKNPGLPWYGHQWAGTVNPSAVPSNSGTSDSSGGTSDGGMSAEGAFDELTPIEEYKTHHAYVVRALGYDPEGSGLSPDYEAPVLMGYYNNSDTQHPLGKPHSIEVAEGDEKMTPENIQLLWKMMPAATDMNWNGTRIEKEAAGPHINDENVISPEFEEIGGNHKFVLDVDGNFYAWSKSTGGGYGHALIALENDGELWDELDDYLKSDWVLNDANETYDEYRSDGWATGTTSSGGFILVNCPNGLNDAQINALLEQFRVSSYRSIVIHNQGVRNFYNNSRDAINALSSGRLAKVGSLPREEFFKFLVVDGEVVGPWSGRSGHHPDVLGDYLNLPNESGVDGDYDFSLVPEDLRIIGVDINDPDDNGMADIREEGWLVDAFPFSNAIEYPNEKEIQAIRAVVPEATEMMWNFDTVIPFPNMNEELEYA